MAGFALRRLAKSRPRRAASVGRAPTITASAHAAQAATTVGQCGDRVLTARLRAPAFRPTWRSPAPAMSGSFPAVTVSDRRMFDLHDVGAELGQEVGRHGSREVAREVDDPQRRVGLHSDLAVVFAGTCSGPLSGIQYNHSACLTPCAAPAHRHCGRSPRGTAAPPPRRAPDGHPPRPATAERIRARDPPPGSHHH